MITIKKLKPLMKNDVSKQDLSKLGHNRADSGYSSSQSESVHVSDLTGSEVSSLGKEVSLVGRISALVAADRCFSRCSSICRCSSGLLRCSCLSQDAAQTAADVSLLLKLQRRVAELEKEKMEMQSEMDNKEEQTQQERTKVKNIPDNFSMHIANNGQS